MLHQGKSSRGKGMSRRGDRGRSHRDRRREENYEGSEFNDLGEQSQNRSRSSTAGKTKLTWIPQEYMGLVIGKHGAKLKEISQESGAVLEIRNRDIYISGSPLAQEQATQMIREIISSPKKKQSMKMSSVPKDCMGAIIGKDRKTLRTIEGDTDTTLKIHGHDYEIEIFGKPENQCKARLKIKEIISTVLANRDKACTKSVPYIERSCVCEEAEFTLESVDPPYNCSSNERFYRLQLFDKDMLAEDGKAEVHGGDLKNDLLKILRKLHREKEECDLELDMWCHFGCIYLRGVDEHEASEGDLFSMDDIESKIKPAAASKKHMWGTRFRNGITKMELEELEKSLKETALSPSEDHRWDLSFLTPSYRHVRAKVWLNKTEQDQATADVESYSFSSTPPVEVRNQLLRVSSEEDENESSPTICLCVPHRRRFAADIIFPGYRFDCRLVLRSNETDASVNQRPHEKEEDQIIADYLSQMQLDKNSGSITLPPEIDNFDISYNRRSLRQTYSYTSADVPCSLTVSKEKETTDKDADCADKYVDIHLHCDKWDKLLKEGNWQPEEIVDTLPQFLQFVARIQTFLRYFDKQSDVELEQ